MKYVWLVYFDVDEGDRENWSVFYCEPEVYDDETLCNDRVEVLKKIAANPQHDMQGADVHVVKIEVNLEHLCQP